MPNPIYCERNPITEKLERMDMMRRREVLDIPEFYVGLSKIGNFKKNFFVPEVFLYRFYNGCNSI